MPDFPKTSDKTEESRIISALRLLKVVSFRVKQDGLSFQNQLYLSFYGIRP